MKNIIVLFLLFVSNMVFGASIVGLDENQFLSLTRGDNNDSSEELNWMFSIKAPGNSLSNKLEFGANLYQCDATFSGIKQSSSSHGTLVFNFASVNTFDITVTGTSPYNPVYVGVTVPQPLNNIFIFEIINGTGNQFSTISNVLIDGNLAENQSGTAQTYSLIQGINDISNLSFNFSMPYSTNGTSFIKVYNLAIPETSTSILVLLSGLVMSFCRIRH